VLSRKNIRKGKTVSNDNVNFNRFPIFLFTGPYVLIGYKVQRVYTNVQDICTITRNTNTVPDVSTITRTTTIGRFQ